MSGSRGAVAVHRDVQPHEVVLQGRHAPAQAPREARDLHNALLNDAGFRQRLEEIVIAELRASIRLATKPYLSVPDLTAYLCFDSEAATWQWLHRHPEVRKHRAGRRVLVRRGNVDEAIQPTVE